MYIYKYVYVCMFVHVYTYVCVFKYVQLCRKKVNVEKVLVRGLFYY